MDRYESYPQEEMSEFRSIFPIQVKNRYSMRRLESLAHPKIRPQTIESSKRELLSVSSLIIYGNSPRLAELALPKRTMMPPPKDTGVSQRALRAEASARIIELAKPRHSVDLDQLRRIRNPQQYYSSHQRRNKRLKASSHSWVSNAEGGLPYPRRFRRTLSQRSVIDLGKTADKQPKKPRAFR